MIHSSQIGTLVPISKYLDYLSSSRAPTPGIQVPVVARVVAISGTCMLVSACSSQPAWWGEHKLAVKLITGRGGGGGTGSCWF
jgi:hypothetical protein